jgi:hypothetical protein
MAARIEQATADLPMPRGYDELDAAERSRLAELVSMSEEELEATINATEDEFEGATEEQELDGDPPVAILVRDPVQD